MVQYSKSTNAIEAMLASPFLTSLDRYYPDISHWYTNTVVPGLMTSESVLLLAKEQGRIVGMALGKRGEEAKLRCVRVLPQFQNTGVGVRLIERMFTELECEKPHCTVAQELLDQYARLFINRFGFSLGQVDKGTYRTGKLEYCFNL